MNQELEDMHGEPSFRLRSPMVDLFVTRRGGHMAPVHFRLGSGWVSPYSLPPWKPGEVGVHTLPILAMLRGDFFCLPFGESRGIPYVHGDPANLSWNLVEASKYRLALKMDMKKPVGHILKTIRIRPNHRAVYLEHVVSGLTGKFNFGHHAILQFPETGGPFQVNTSPFRFGRVKPDAFTNPASREYGSLKTGARFKSLAKVPLAMGGTTSLHDYPDRVGYEDLAMVSSKKGDFAWTAVTLDGYVWLSLKDPRILPSTLFWVSNGGRHQEPWLGRHRGRLGLEEVSSYFCDGLDVSRKDLLKREGIPTTHGFTRKTPTVVRLIQLAHPVPKDFGMVTQVERESGETISFCNARGHRRQVSVDWAFLYGKDKA